MRAFIHSACLFGFIFFIVGIGAAQTDKPATPAGVPAAIPPTAGAKDERYRIGYQDTLSIQVFRHSQLNQRVNVNANGTINLFGLKEPIVAVCKTERELAGDVAEAYRKDYLKNPEVTVEAVEQRSRAFAIMGAVEKPGQFMISRRVRLIELLALAGGPTKEAGTRVLVARTGSTSNCKMNEVTAVHNDGDDIPVYSYRLSDVLEGKENLVMQPGDIASVMDADVIYVYGNVNKQGQVEIKEPLTLTQVLVSAEGLKSASDRGKIRVLRQKPGGTEREEFIYNLDDISKRKVPDPFLEPNDIVAVNVDKTKEIFNTIGRTMTQGIPSLFYRIP